MRVITFDVGGTLLEPWPSVGHVYARVAERFDIRVLTPDSLTAAFAQAWQARQNFDYSKLAWRNLVQRTFGHAWPRHSPENLFEAIYQEFAHPDTWLVFDDVLPTLRALRGAGYRLGIISNWDERLRPLIRDLRLDSWFECILVSHETGATKPDRAMFQAAARAFGVTPEECLHVGDSLREDVEGAVQAGLRAAHLRRGHQHSTWPRLGTLLELVGSLETNK